MTHVVTLFLLVLFSLCIFQQNPYPSNAVKINEIKRDVKNLEEKIKSMQKQYVELNKNLKLEKDKIETIEKLENKLNKISEKEKQQEQEQTRKKKRNILL